MSDKPLKFERALNQVVSGEKAIEDFMRESGKDPDRRQDSIRVNVVDQQPAILEVQAPRGKGLAFRGADVE
ncbi:MAG: hypothetical protein R2688_01405 [Fimbriimonadaceae bacterium]